MKYTETDNKIILTEFDSFNIEETLECGQCFRFEKTDPLKYEIVACGRVLNIWQQEDKMIFYPCNTKDFEEIWIDYFDLNTDYNAIKEKLSKTDDVMKRAVEYASGIRILKQQPFECLLSFIISQNNNIPRIKGIIGALSQKYGTESDGKWLFPQYEQLINVTEEDYFALKMGFRAKYMFDAMQKIGTEVNLEKLKAAQTDELRSTLMLIKGVGQKVADCTLMFGFGRCEVFPTDVWVKRVMEHLYFDGKDTDIKTIHAFAKQRWGDIAGYAQQYLFYYARTLKIGKNKS